MGEYRFRYTEIVTEHGVELVLSKFKVIKKTPRGAWVNQLFTTFLGGEFFHGKKRFVLDGNSGRRYCYTTLDAALNSYKIRKKRQISHAKSAMVLAEFMLNQLDSVSTPPEDTLCFPDEERVVLSDYIFD